VVVDSFTIGQLAHAAHVNIETVRYYERRGLLRQPPRTPAGYRQYSSADLCRLQFIARAKRLGFTLTETVNLLDDSDNSVVLMARNKIRALDEQRRALDATRARLLRLIDICGDPSSEDCLALRVTS